MPTTEGQDENCQLVKIRNRTCSMIQSIIFIFLLHVTSELILHEISIPVSNIYNLTGVVCFRFDACTVLKLWLSHDQVDRRQQGGSASVC